MFYSHTLLAKKGPLAKVWLAAHLEKKLNRAIIQQTDIKKVAEEIRKPAQPLALRLSGQLLLGITRIYYKKVTLLYEDGQSALKKLSEFFKPGQVDMVESDAGANVMLADADEAEDKPAYGFGDAGAGDGADPFAEDGNEAAWLFENQGAKGKSKAGIPLSDASNTRLAAEMTMEEAFDAPRSGRRGRVSDVEMLRRAEVTPTNGVPPRSSLSGGMTGSTDDEERRSMVSGSDAGDSTRRSRRARPEEVEAAAVRRKGRASLLLDEDLGGGGGGEDYGMADALQLADLAGGGQGMEMDMGMDMGAPEHDYGTGGDGVGVGGEGGVGGDAASSSSSSSSSRGLVGSLEVLEALRSSKTDVKADAAKRERADVLQRKRAEAKSKAREKQIDARVVIPGDTIREWLKDATAITKPRRSGQAAMAAVFTAVECSRNKKRLGGGGEGASSLYPTPSVAMACDLVSRLDTLHLPPGVWNLVGQPGAGVYHADPSTDMAARLVAAELGDARTAHAAAKKRCMVGLRDLAGLGDLTEDGDVLRPCPAILDPAVSLSSHSRVGGSLVGAALAKLWGEHANSKAVYPPSSTAPLGGGKGGASGSGEEEGEEAAGGEDGRGGDGTDGGDYTGGGGEQDYGDAGGGGSGGNHDGMDMEGTGWNELDGAGRTPDVAGSAKSGVGSSADRPSLLQSLASSGGGGGKPPSAADADEELVDVVGGGGEEGEGADAPSSALIGSDVDPRKMHAATVVILKAIASVMTGPTGGGEGGDGKAAGKKRKSREDGGLAPFPAGDLHDIARGVGSPASPLTFSDLTAGQSKRAAAYTFYQLLILKSMDVIAVAQAEPCGDIAVTRTERFAVAVDIHSK